jgi:hypothetical protein
MLLLEKFKYLSSVADLDPVLFVHLDPGWNKIPLWDPGFGININSVYYVP